MEERRPEFCHLANCPMYEGGRCRLDEEIRRWPSIEGRKRERRRMEHLAEEDPLHVVSLCSRAGLGLEDRLRPGTVLFID